MRNFLFGVLLVIIGNVAFAQTNTANSPYSSFGLGEFGVIGNAVFSGIGNSVLTYQDSTVINFFNPSSYNTLAKGLPLFSLGSSTRFSNYSEGDNTDFSSITVIEHFAFAVPFAKNFGLAFGLKPYTRRGYEFSSRIAVDDDSLYYNYSGKGGINEGFLGFSANLINKRNTRLSIGANGGYLFGNVENTRKSGLIVSGVSNNQYAGGVSVERLRAGAFHYQLGLTFEHKINEKHSIGIAASIDPLQKIKGAYETGLFFTYDITQEHGYDTLSFSDTLSGYVTNVPDYNFGARYTLNFTGNKDDIKQIQSELSFHLAYGIADWTKYNNTYDTGFVNNFLNTQNMSFGIQYVPEKNFVTTNANIKYYHKIRYRIGVNYRTLPYSTNGEQVTDFGTTFGFGLPIPIKKTLSSVNLGFVIGKRGISDRKALNEKYYGLNLGITIAPFANDKWFVKRKLN